MACLNQLLIMFDLSGNFFQLVRRPAKHPANQDEMRPEEAKKASILTFSGLISGRDVETEEPHDCKWETK